MIDKNRYKALEILDKLSSSDNIYTREFVSSELSSIKDLSINKSEIFMIVLGVSSLKHKYDYIISDLYNGDYQKLKSKLKNILRMGCYLIEEHKSTPDHAAVSVCVDIAKYSMKGYEKLVNALLRKYISISSPSKLLSVTPHSGNIIEPPSNSSR